MSDNTSTVTEETVEDRQSLKYLLQHVSPNPALLEFPRDISGFTTELRAAIRVAASRVQGFEDKQTLLLNTLYVAIAHIKARFDKDLKSREEISAWQSKLSDSIGAVHTYSNQ